MSFTLTGAEQLLAHLSKAAKFEDVKRAVKLNGTELNRNMARNASFDKGYQTGTTKRSINLQISNGGLTATVAPTTEYAAYLEYGTRFMSAQPFIGPSYHPQKAKFLEDLSRLVE